MYCLLAGLLSKLMYMTGRSMTVLASKLALHLLLKSFLKARISFLEGVASCLSRMRKRRVSSANAIATLNVII
jgi:hypothetical protein